MELLILAIPVIWLSFSVYLFWYITSASYNILISRKDAKTSWKIHKSNKNCVALKWKTLKLEDGKIIGYKCHCGHEYYQKKPIMSRMPKNSSQRIIYNQTLLSRI
jgi:hypothetical protein